MNPKLTAPKKLIKDRKFLIRCTQAEYALMLQNAENFADGNLNEWVRFSASHEIWKKMILPNSDRHPAKIAGAGNRDQSPSKDEGAG